MLSAGKGQFLCRALSVSALGSMWISSQPIPPKETKKNNIKKNLMIQFVFNRRDEVLKSTEPLSKQTYCLQGTYSLGAQKS